MRIMERNPANSGLPPSGLSPEAARELIETMPLSMVITDPHRPGAPIVYVNRAFEEVTGYSARFAVGRNCRFLQGDDTDQPGLVTLRAALRARSLRGGPAQLPRRR